MKTPGFCPRSIGVHWPASWVEVSERGAVVRFVYGSIGLLARSRSPCTDTLRYAAVMVGGEVKRGRCASERKLLEVYTI